MTGRAHQVCPCLFPPIPPLVRHTTRGGRAQLGDPCPGTLPGTVRHTGHGQKADRFQGGRIGNERAALACTRKPMGSIRPRGSANRSCALSVGSSNRRSLTHLGMFSANSRFAAVSFGWLVLPRPQKPRISASNRRAVCVVGGAI